MSNIKRGSRKQQGVEIVNNLARKACKSNLVFRKKFGLKKHSLSCHDQPYEEMAVSEKRKSSSDYSVSKHRRHYEAVKEATGDKDNEGVQIAAEVFNDNVDVHGKEVIEGNKTRAENSEMKSYASNKTLPVKLTRVQSVVKGQVDTMMQDGTFIHAADDHRANMVELQANVVETESSLEHYHPEFIDHCDSLGKKQESQMRPQRKHQTD